MSKRYMLIFLLILGLSGCAEKRVITINTYDTVKNSRRGTYTSTRRRPPPSRVVRREPQEERIKEEILVHNSTTNVVTRIDEVSVPPNRPTLGIRSSHIDRGVERGVEITPTVARVNTGLNGQVMQRMNFPIEEYQALPKSGDSTLTGRVYLINSIDDREIIKRGLKLYLNPVTSYSKQWYEHSYLEGYKMTPPDKRLYNYLKFTTSDANGEFHFYGIPAGEYYLGAKIRCGSECGYESEKIIRVVKEVSVGYGTTTVDLTKVVP